MKAKYKYLFLDFQRMCECLSYLFEALEFAKSNPSHACHLLYLAMQNSPYEHSSYYDEEYIESMSGELEKFNVFDDMEKYVHRASDYATILQAIEFFNDLFQDEYLQIALEKEKQS